MIKFGPRTVLNSITFSVPRCKTTVIIGASGCGKSTLLKLMVGYLKPDAGQILYDGADITTMDDDQLDPVRKRFGILFQNGALFNSMTVGENVALPLVEHTNLDSKIIRMIVKMKLELVGLRGFEDLKPAQISGGMKKRVGLARAIALDPEIVYYDEPSAGLDPITAAVIDDLMVDLSHKLNITSVVVTHHMDSAFKIADNIIMLHGGRIIAQGAPDAFRRSADPLIRQFVEGLADGPVPFQMSADDYIQDLLQVN
ncbi:MAG: ABC transporter ATP-binding protein [Candidatus Omnitrophota bacterium]|jgi:phospholipid/cholesterol/gamma-HCH transport system ATP-binding protein|nr:MAG: ABC transporter ATP-binding protein [Candidatus Omnitrophota bacterium]